MTTNDQLYTEEVTCERKASLLAGPGFETTTLSELRSVGGLLKAFADDIDIQQMTVVSTNLGFVRQYTKHFTK